MLHPFLEAPISPGFPLDNFNRGLRLGEFHIFRAADVASAGSGI